MTDTTVLVLSGIGVPPYSARGLTQSLTPLDQAADLRRSINGKLIDLSVDEFKKYKSTISGNDQQPPAIEGIWPGLHVTVDCIAELSYLTESSGSGGASREIVASRTEGDFTFYRPRLDMVIMNFSITRDEYGDVVSWTMELEEE